MKTYFVAVIGLKDDGQKWISGLFDTKEDDVRKVWKEVREFYSKDFNG